MFADYFDGRKVLVTGVTGVKGTWLALLLLEAGATVTGLDKRPPLLRSNFTGTGLASRIHFALGDVTDLAFVRPLVEEADCVFHLAAEPIVGVAFRQPLDTYRSNTLGTATLLEALRVAASPKRGVFVTTDKVYRAKPRGHAWVEADELGATGPYAVSKACAELVIRDYQYSYFARGGVKIAVARAGNVLIGGDDYSSSLTHGAGRIFVDCYRALAEGRRPEIFTPSFTRPYTYGLDILCGYMTLMSLLDRETVSGEAFNFGPREESGVSNGMLATKICHLWGTSESWESGPPRDEPFAYQSLCTDKSRRLLNWQPAYNLDEALRDTTAWYKEWEGIGPNLTEGCMYDFNRELVSRHRSAAARLVDGCVANG